MNTDKLSSELLYEYTGRLTRVTDYGVPLHAVLAGEIPPPAAGLRVDIEFEAEVRGRLEGTIQGVDHLNVRADGRMDLDIMAVITTRDGARIAVTAGGVALPEPGTSRSLLRENVRLTTHSPAHAWLNPLQIWAVGTADPSQGSLHVRGYLAV